LIKATSSYDCSGFQLSATATGGDGTYSDWSWTNQDGMNLWGWENSLWYSIWNGEGDVIVSVEDGCGEIASDTVSATTSIVLMQVTQETNYTVTCGSQITLSPEVEFGLEPYYFSWTDMNWFTLGNGSTYTFTAMANTQIQLTISDGCGGYYYNIININIENIPVDLVMPPAFTGTCTEVFLIDPEVSGGYITDDYEYAWSVNGSSVGTDETLAYTTPVSSTVLLTVTDECGTQANGQVDINIVNIPPVLSLSPDMTLTCVETGEFEAFVADGEAPFEYLWTVNGLEIGSGNIAEYQANETSEIECTVTDICGLTDAETVTLFIDNPAIDFTAIPDSSICRGSEITLFAEASGGAGTISYEWTGEFLQSSEATAQVEPGATTEYTLVISDECNQFEEYEVEIEVQYVDADFISNYITENEVQFVPAALENCTDCSFLWNFGDGSSSNLPDPLHTFDGLAQYQVQLLVMNELGCTDITYEVVYPPIELYVPNAFTPDGDGINDVFQVYGSGILRYELIIFNRWGDVIFRSTDMDQAWTGNVRNGDYFAKDGVYTYVIKYEGVSKEAEEISGQILIIR
jgi:gliding motility-associated-like protein